MTNLVKLMFLSISRRRDQPWRRIHYFDRSELGGYLAAESISFCAIGQSITTTNASATIWHYYSYLFNNCSFPLWESNMPYGAAKAALNSFNSKSLANEVSSKKVHVLTVSPGPVNTEGMQAFLQSNMVYHRGYN